MLTLLVTGSDTAVGKTHVVGALARMLAEHGAVQIVKVVETGRTAGVEGDAETACRLALHDIGTNGSSLSLSRLTSHTLVSFAAPVAPAAAAALEGKTVSLDALVAALRDLAPCAWRIVEGAGGIATPIDPTARDWADFAVAANVDAIVVVVPDRLGAINQARLAYARAVQTGIPAGVWLNAVGPVEQTVADSTRAGLASAMIPVWGEQDFGRVEPSVCRASVLQTPARSNQEAGVSKTDALHARCQAELEARERQNLRRRLRVAPVGTEILNLADNDYLALAGDPALARAVADAALHYGTSASASPLITGWREPHERLVQRLAAWHGFSCGLLWSSGYAANAAVLSGLPRREDRIFADRLIHNSMIAGLQRSGARFQRYEHLNLDRLEQLLAQSRAAGGQTFVVTESLFSMDGDYPDFGRMTELKRRYGFVWIVDEAHGVGWYGPEGAGLVRAAAVTSDVDVLVGTFGKALGSGGAYTLFRDESVRDYLINTAGEFIYSTSLPPTTVAAAAAGIERIAALATEQPAWHAASRAFRAALRGAGWNVPAGDSPIVPIRLDDAQAAVSAAEALRANGIVVGAVRPPTVPAGTSRLRLSLKRTFQPSDAERVLAALDKWRRRS